MEMTAYVSFYKDLEVDVFDPVRWPISPFETRENEQIATNISWLNIQILFIS